MALPRISHPLYRVWAALPDRMVYSENPADDESVSAIRRALPLGAHAVTAKSVRQELFDLGLIRMVDGCFVKSAEFRPDRARARTKQVREATRGIATVMASYVTVHI